MKNILKMVLVVATSLCGTAYAGGNFVSLGAGADCTVNTLQGGNLQDLLNLTPAEIRLVNNVTYIGQFVATAGVIIRGGYDSCADATNDIQGVNSSVINGNFQGTTLTLDALGDYTLEQIALINGSNPSDRGGGLLLKTDMNIFMDRVTVENNEAQFGGGIFKGSDLNVLLVIKDSIIKDNLAAFNPNAGLGGGIYFDIGGELIVYGDTQITENQARGGGGLYLDDAQATFVGGANASINSGISLNKATAFGGGLYARNSNVTISGGVKDIPGIGVVGEAGKSFNVTFNEADSDQSNNGDGGGLYFDINSTANLEAVTIALNKSYVAGGMMVNNGSMVNVGRPHSGVCQISDLMGCNFFVQNTAKENGGLYVTGAAKVSIQSANFNNNRSDYFTAISVTSPDTELSISSSVFHDNGDSGLGPYLDRYVIFVFNDALLKITQSTAVKNKASWGFIYNNSANLKSYNNYLFNNQTGSWLVEAGTATSDYQCLVLDNTHNVIDQTNYITVGADSMNLNHFMDAANKDFHLPDNSFFQDFVGSSLCPTSTNLGTSLKDIDGEPRTNFADLGADENLSNDIIFANDFESTHI